jgi:hypothetical protein
MKSYQISMTIEFTIDANNSNDGYNDITEWEIERHALAIVRKGVQLEGEKFSEANEDLFTSGRVRTIQTTVSEGLGGISYVNTDPLTMNNALSMYNHMARDINVFDEDWEIVKTHKELMQQTRDSVWSLPQLDETTFRRMWQELGDEYQERSRKLLWSSMRSAVCTHLSGRMEDNLYTLPASVNDTRTHLEPF